MRWTRLRFTVRRMMIVVAALALILGGSLEAIRLKRYRDECLKRAGTHAQWEQTYFSMEQSSREMVDLYESLFVGSQDWSERGEYDGALAAYEQALRADPEDESALNDLAWFLATCPEARLRDGKRAVELATRACEVTGRSSPSHLDTLAAAHAEAGDFETAVEVQREAIGMLPPGDPNAKGYRERQEAYKASKPYRDRGQVTD